MDTFVVSAPSSPWVLRAPGAGLVPELESSPVESLRLAAVVADQAAEGVGRLADVWHALCSGRRRILCSVFTSSRCLFVLRTAAVPTPLSDVRRRVLEAILSGAGQKTVGYELGVAPSTVATYARGALEQLGIHGRMAHVSPLLVLAAKAAREPTVQTGARFSSCVHRGETLWVVGAPRPDTAITRIPPAEQAVLRSLVEGWAYGEIAQQRGRSVRTIANQLAAVFRRLGVSGRCELILALYGLHRLPSAG